MHLFHRPWWGFYVLHFAIPLAWLSGFGIAELVRIAAPEPKTNHQRQGAKSVVSVLLASALVAAMLVLGFERLRLEVARLRQLPRVEADRVVATMRGFAGKTRWVYCRETMYPFHAGLAVIPELAVIPQKRFWSGQISNDFIWETVRRYRPEQLLLTAGELTPSIREFIENGYEPVCRDGLLTLYVIRSLVREGDTGTNHEP